MSKQVSQNIKPSLEKETITKIIKSITTYDEKKEIYIFSNVEYKRMCYHEQTKDILKTLRPHYYESKRFYLDRKLTFKSFSTILRQICKFVKIDISSRVVYTKSDYMIIYTIKL